MSDFFQQFNRQQEINEGLFGNLFSKNKNSQQQVPVNQDFYQALDGSFVFGGKSTAKSLDAITKNILIANDFDLRNSNLNFLLFPDTEFHAENMIIDLKKQTINIFRGNWLSGTFKGRKFEGIFNGSSFQGYFFGKYIDYKALPYTFVDGTFYDTTKSGILGLPNTTTLHKLGNKKFNLITVPVGHYFQFRSKNGVSAYIKVLKRLDETNSDFRFEVLNGFAKQKTPQIIDISWNDFRSDFYKIENKRVYNINKNSKNIANLIQIPETDSILEWYISTAPANFIAPEIVQEPEVVVPMPPSPLQTPGMSSGKTAKQHAKNFVKESIRNVVRNIINETF